MDWFQLEISCQLLASVTGGSADGLASAVDGRADFLPFGLNPFRLGIVDDRTCCSARLYSGVCATEREYSTGPYAYLTTGKGIANELERRMACRAASEEVFCDSSANDVKGSTATTTKSRLSERGNWTKKKRRGFFSVRQSVSWRRCKCEACVMEDACEKASQAKVW